MFKATDWELFNTIVDEKECEYIVDQISIDVKNKRYMLELNESDMCTDGCDEWGNEICSITVSREVYEMLLEGVERKGFRRVTIG